LRNSSFVLLALTFCFTLIDFILSLKKTNEYKFSLSLFLHFPPSVILQNNLFVQILNGDFRQKKYSSISLTDTFFKFIIDKLPNSIITTNSEGRILDMNKRATEIFGDNKFRSNKEMFQ
jgi:PAS domain-containing protein